MRHLIKGDGEFKSGSLHKSFRHDIWVARLFSILLRWSYVNVKWECGVTDHAGLQKWANTQLDDSHMKFCLSHAYR